MKNELLHLLVT